MKKKVLIGIIVILIAAVFAGYGYWRTHPTHFSFNITKSKSVNSPNVKIPKNKSTQKATASAQTTTNSLNQMKDDAKSFYQLIYSKNYDQAKQYMTSDFTKSLDQAVNENQSNDASVAKDIASYTTVKTPSSVEDPVVIAKDLEYEVTLKLSDDYEARVGFKKTGKSYKIFSFSAQDTNMNNGGYAGNSQKGK
ncbi:hypothetical protein [Pseudoramibacter sp.]|jgi:hypothetical protein|uniref:hypothetical protein n=1 Tax=Pseudoramibacter sp. TaxID=2034862 RepID=UPI0025EDBF9D|nr:hypothetical protein [Pseudoramibacter sp.]MCH4072931.1 hypothetical protein [Pseudoramibacter sp.]MCH4106702.1 hypothetical protein [Pseudoramibacter sp.]